MSDDEPVSGAAIELAIKDDDEGDDEKKGTKAPDDVSDAKSPQSPRPSVVAALNKEMSAAISSARDPRSVSPWTGIVHMIASFVLLVELVAMLTLSNLDATMKISTGILGYKPWDIPFVYIVAGIDIWMIVWYVFLSWKRGLHETFIRMRYNPVRWIITSVTLPATVALIGILCALEAPLLFTVVLLCELFVLVGCAWQNEHAVRVPQPASVRTTGDDVDLDDASDAPFRLDDRPRGMYNAMLGWIMLVPFFIVAFIFVYQLQILVRPPPWIQFLPAGVVFFGLAYIFIERLNVAWGIRFTVVDRVYVGFDSCVLFILTVAVISGTEST